MKADEGVAPVVAVALLIGLVAVAGAIIGLTMFAAMEEASGTPPDVRFQTSANDSLLYHAGGEVLYKKELVFYDTSKGSEKNTANISDRVRINGKTDWTTWSTGQAIETPLGTNVSMLSVVGLDSRNVPVMLWMGANAAALPIGDMVPDEWGEVAPKPIGPTPVPTPVPIGGDGGSDTADYLNSGSSGKDTVKFGNVNLLNGKILTLEIEYPHPAEDTPVMFIIGNANYKINKINLTIYNKEWGDVVYSIEKQGKRDEILNVKIAPNYLNEGYTCYIIIEIWKNDKEPIGDPDFRRTTVIKII